MEFLGYIRPDGSVGVRNHILLISADPSTNRLCCNAAKSVLNTVPFPAFPDKTRWVQYASAVATNPNVAGAVVIEPAAEGPGESIVKTLAQAGKPADLVTVGISGGAIEASARAVRSAMIMVREASAARRQLALISRLAVGLLYSGKTETGDLLYHCISLLVENNARILMSKSETGKQDSIGGLPVVGTLTAGGNIGRARGIYEIERLDNGFKTMTEMVLKGVQLVVVAEGSPYPGSHALLPAINITADRNYSDLLKDAVEVDLSGLDFESYKIEDYSLLVVNEIIATASGKLTKAEVLKV